jgi:hypothetical protein
MTVLKILQESTQNIEASTQMALKYCIGWSRTNNIVDKGMHEKKRSMTKHVFVLYVDSNLA